jgi:hypothetical protein
MTLALDGRSAWVDVHGIATQGRFIWLADNRAGLLCRFVIPSG